jgi:hypothetical protein
MKNKALENCYENRVFRYKTFWGFGFRLFSKFVGNDFNFTRFHFCYEMVNFDKVSEVTYAGETM